MSMEPEFRFCTSPDGTRIAYGIYGSGSPLLFAPILSWSMAQAFATDGLRPIFDVLARQVRLVTYDLRGAGASTRDPEDVSLEADARDLSAVADAAELPRFTLLAGRLSALRCAAYAAAHPERVERLVVWGPYTEGADLRRWARSFRGDWSHARGAWAWSASWPRAWERAMKEATSAETVARRLEVLAELDAATLLPRVSVPTLMVESEALPRGDAMRWASLVPNARVQFIATDDHVSYPLPFAQAVLAFTGLDEVAGAAAHSSAATAVILLTDIVDSTALTERLGDARFREASRALDAGLRAAIRDAGGAAIDGKLLGDGVLATFPSAAQAIDGARRCLALSAASELGLHIGLHAGDVIREENNVYGGAVNIASRICGLSAPGEILVSDVVRGMARSSASVTFEDRGEKEMKGVGEPVRVYGVRWRE
ncbi:MAG TPA: adenylate/guanylate cyclase domain-containing protein [Dehalococcoidia bacterium]|nr:adenylate/guanylate cyclase domain-containing protein [Dehalococcoidia bacterium]